MSNPRLAALPCERMRGCSFAENFVTEDRLTINTGTITGSGATVASAVTFDGTQHVDFDIVSQALPASAVVRFSATETSEGVLLGNANLIAGTPADGFCIWVDVDGVKATYSDGVAIETPLEIDLDYTTGSVFTATYVFTATSHTLYVNAETPDTAVTTTTGPIGEATAVMVGGDGSDNFVGTIYKTRILDATLTAGEHALYYADTLVSFVDDAYASYGCATFGNDTDGNKIWDDLSRGRDLTKGDGSTAGTFPTFTDYASHRTQYYAFDGVDDYVSDWPTMPATYTVSAALSTSYPGGAPYVSQVNDTTVQTLLTTGGSFTGNLHNLIIFEGVLEQIQLYHLEWTQLSRLWLWDYADPFTHRLIREPVCQLAHNYTDSVTWLSDMANTDMSENDITPTLENLVWSEDGVSFPDSDSVIELAADNAVDVDQVTIFASITDFDTGITSGTLCKNGTNYSVYVESTGGAVDVEMLGSAMQAPALSDMRSIAITCVDGGKPQLYINGVWADEGDSTVTIDSANGDQLYIGNNATPDDNCPCTLDQFKVFDCILTPAEIALLHRFVFGMPAYEEAPYATLWYTGGATRTLTLRGTLNAVVWIDWGDGSTLEPFTLLGTSTDVDCVHTYAAGEYAFKIYGDLSDVTRLDANADTSLYGDVSGLAPLTSLDTLYLFSTSVSGDVSGLAPLTSLVTLYLINTDVSGDVSGLAPLTSLTSVYAQGTDLSGDVTGLAPLTSLVTLLLNTSDVSGDISGLAPLTLLTLLRLYNTSVQYSASALPVWDTTEIQTQNCAMTETEVDNGFNAHNTAGKTGGSLRADGTNAAPSAGVIAGSIAALQAAGVTCTYTTP